MLDEDWNVYLLEVNVLPDENGRKSDRLGKLINIKLETQKLELASIPISDDRWKIFHEENKLHKTVQSCYTNEGKIIHDSDMYLISNEALNPPFYNTLVSPFCNFDESQTQPPNVKDEL